MNCPVHLLKIFFLSLAGVFFGIAAQAIPAFPGAEGFGVNALGGRGGDVYYVTNLDDDAKGSLRYGVTSARGPRTILFKVSGTIHLSSALTIKQPRITIAGQSAPGDGICLADNSLTIDASDVVVRHLRVRLGTERREEQDAITIQGGTNIVVDHCSASWSVDETLSVVNEAENVTVQWCYITESLNQSVHKKGAHGYGSLIRPRHDARYTFHHNLFAHHSSRNPRPGTYDEKLLRLDFCNNVIYNWGFKAGYDNFPEERVQLNYVNNYLIAGPSTSWFESAFDSSGTNTQIFQSGNRFDINRDGVMNGTNQGWKMFSGPITRAEVPFPAPPIYTDPADVALGRVLAQGGAMPWRRDVVDARVVASVGEQNGRIINNTSDVGGWPELKSAEAPLDSDNDGMPDFWEHGLRLNPTTHDNNGDSDSDCYTNLEDYLNWLANPHVVCPRNKAVTVNLRTLNGGSKNFEYQIVKVNNGRTKLLKDGYTAQFEPKKNFSGLTMFSYTAKDSEISFGPVPVHVLVTGSNIKQ